MIQLSDLTKSFGDRVLLDHVTWQIGDGDRVGLCGPNGAGKTTLLKMLGGFDEPDSGAIVKPALLTIGYLPQDGLTHSGRTVFEEVSTAFQPLLDMQREMEEIEHRLGDSTVPQTEHDAMLVRYSELQDRFRLAEGYSMDLRIASVLRGLGFTPEDHGRPAETFSGGWQMRIALAKLLLGRPNLLLLDEPTNHLDLEARNWLEEYLSTYPYAVILVSHDRYFLDAVVTRITDLNLRKLTDYVGNYSKYVEQRDAMLERLRTMKREQDEEVARIEMFINRFRYQATKAAQVQSRIKLLEKVVPIEVPPERKRIHFTFPTCAKSGRTVLELKHVRKAYPPPPGSGGQPVVVFRDLNLHIERGERIALVGPNGAGKSTLIGVLATLVTVSSGEVRYGQRTAREGGPDLRQRIGLLAHELHLYGELTARQNLAFFASLYGLDGTSIDSALARAALFDRADDQVVSFSRGMRQRLGLERALLHNPRLVLLDEPFTGLDDRSVGAVSDRLRQLAAGGAIVLVATHDLDLADRLVTRVALMRDSRLVSDEPAAGGLRTRYRSLVGGA